MKTILSAAIGAMLALSAIEAGAQTKAAERKVELAIEQQSLADALNEWAKQTGLQLVSSSSEMMNTTVAPRIKGAYTTQGALEELLKGTSLTYEWVSERAVAIREKPLVVPAALQSGGADRKETTVPIARFSSEAWGERRVAANDQSSSDGVSSPKRIREPDTEDIEELEEVLVTGTHIRGNSNETSPVIVLDRASIESTGVGTTTALVETIPQNFSLSSPPGVAVPGTSGLGSQGSSINLRGIGEGTTLILLNGRRLAAGYLGAAVDISALPISALERVEILTDSASAIYGSDAVGGVVNFILRSDFEGADTRVRTGWADGGVNEYRVSQLIGNAWDNGNALISAEYYKRDLLRATERDFVPSTSIIGSLYPRDRNYAVVLSGRQELTDAVTLSGDALHTKRDSYNEGGQVIFEESYEVDNPQTSATVALDWSIGSGWHAELSGSYAENESDVAKSNSVDIEAGLGILTGHERFRIDAGRLQADGPLFRLAGAEVRAAVGVDWRSESLQYDVVYGDGTPVVAADANQIVRSAFGEVYVPLIGPANSRRGARRVELSLAARYDEYSSFGSSFDPRYGFMWEPVAGLRLRASYGTSYVAPKLATYSLAGNVAVALAGEDPFSPTGASYQLQVGGNDPATYSAQESESSSFGIEIAPESLPGFDLGLNYYRINYQNKIAMPPFPSVILGNPASFGSLAIRTPTIEQVESYIAAGQQGVGFFAFNPDFTPNDTFDPASIEVIVDQRQRNLSELRTDGIDLSIFQAFEFAETQLQLGLTGAYILEIEQRVTSASTPFDSVDTVYNPPDYRVRASVSWQRQGWAANLFVNHTDEYTDNRALLPIPVSSYTTVDARLQYSFAKRSDGGFLSGLALSLNAQNLLDEDPPHLAIVNPSADMGFDPTNSSPMGRFVAIELTKSW